MEYFYVPPDTVTPPTLTVRGEEFSHMTHVMRMREGDQVRVVDGKGNAYDALIRTITRHEATCTITARAERVHEPSRQLTLGAGILKNPSRFDYLVEKATELGAAAIVPLLTERTIPHHAKTERWRKLCVAAMKQSGRCILPEVREPMPLGEFLTSAGAGDLKIIPHEKAEMPLSSADPAGDAPAVVCIGPEGGFSDEEIARAQGAGFQPVSLGARRLRTETAALVACAMLLQERRKPPG
jgi:16S rRNA (uracil1498-N3)-methyltransferase